MRSFMLDPAIGNGGVDGVSSRAFFAIVAVVAGDFS